MATTRRDFIKAAGAASLAPLLAANGSVLAQQNGFRRIAVEECFAIPEYLDAMTEVITRHPDRERGWLDFVSGEHEFFNIVLRRLVDMDGERLDLMDAAGVDMAVLSLWAPGVQVFDATQGTEMAKLINDRLAEAIERHPARYAGLATIAPQDPESAAQELERSINTLGLHGVLINSHTDSEFLDQQKFRPILDAAVANNAPIYLHPRRPPRQMAAAFTDYGMDGALWGFALEASTHALRLIMSGIFDEYPDLQIVLGHMGEGLPFWMSRLDTVGMRASTGAGIIKRKPSDYLRENFSISTSGMGWDPVLKFCVEALGADRVMFSVDYPFGSYEEYVTWLDGVDLPDDVKAQIYGTNAERIFGLA